MADTKKGSGNTTTGADSAQLPPENLRAIEWLEEDDQQEDEMGEEWWDEFEEFLRKHRLKIGTTENSA